MKRTMTNNQYDSAGNYLFPEVETKILTVEVSKAQFVEYFYSRLGVPKKYIKVIDYLFENGDKMGWVNTSKFRMPGITYRTYREYLFQMSKFLILGDPLLLIPRKGIYQVNPEWAYDPRKINRAVLEFRHTP